MQDRSTQIEEALAHLQAEVDDLSQLVREQHEELTRLRRQVALLLERAAAQDADGSVVLGDQKPPHY